MSDCLPKGLQIALLSAGSNSFEQDRLMSQVRLAIVKPRPSGKRVFRKRHDAGTCARSFQLMLRVLNASQRVPPARSRLLTKLPRLLSS